MKKIILMFCIVLLTTTFFGCDKKNIDNVTGTTTHGNTTASVSKPAPVTETLQIKDFSPIKLNTKYIYEGKGNEYASYNIYIDYISGSKVQQRVDNGGTVAARIIELKDGKLTEKMLRGEMYYRENLLQIKDSEGEVLLMEPLEKGAKWTLKDKRVRTITNTAADVTTPAGSYKAIEVTTESGSDKIIDYYAKDVGLVKSAFISGDSEVTSSLSKIEENVPLIQNINFYYPNINDNKIYYESKDVSFKTNDVTRQVLEVAYKEIASNKIGSAFSTNTKINSLYLNKDNMVYIDLNKAFLSEMNTGAGYEKMILQSIANTFGQYYNSEKVVVTIDSSPYESGHISMKKGEYIKVKNVGTVEFKK